MGDLQNYIAFFRRIRSTRKKFSASLAEGRYLKPGSYELVLGSFPLLINLKYKMYVNSKRRSVAKRIVLAFWNPPIKIRPQSCRFGFQAMFFTMDGNTKYIDFDRGVMYTVFAHAQKLKRVRDNYLYFSRYFCTGYICCDGTGITEKYIIAKKRENLDQETVFSIFQDILRDLRAYYDAVRKQDGFRKRTMNIESIPELVKYFSIVFDGIDWRSIMQRLGAMPRCLCHGDLHMDNILLQGDIIYYIDFEDSREEIFFYDLFNIMFVEFINYDATYLLDRYLEADARFMEDISPVFSAAGYSFDGADRRFYLLVYIMRRMKYEMHDIEEKCRAKGTALEETTSFLCKRYRLFLNYILEKTNN